MFLRCRLRKKEEEMAKKLAKDLESPLLKDRVNGYGKLTKVELLGILHTAGVALSNSTDKSKCRIEMEGLVGSRDACKYADRVDVSKCPERQGARGSACLHG